MPTYEYQCKACGSVQEETCRMHDKPDTVTCNGCGGEAGKILSASMVLGDDMPAWMRHPETLGCLQPAGEKPIETRSEYNRYLKNKGIASKLITIPKGNHGLGSHLFILEQAVLRFTSLPQ